jgi:predicted membrane protein
MDATSTTSPQDQSLQSSRPPRFTGRLVAGLVILVVGVVFLLDALNVPGMGDVWRAMRDNWPVILILVGVVKLFDACCTRDRVSGSIWVLVGALLLANNYDLITFNIWRIFWPAIIILIGLRMLARGVNGQIGYRDGRRGRWGGILAGGPADSGSRTSAFAILSGATRRVASPDFQGGDATAVMGGCEIDLRQSNIVSCTAVFDVFALMGGIDIFVPGDWTVRNEGFALLGAIEDSRKETAGNPSKVLVIRGAALMGGVEIKN